MRNTFFLLMIFILAFSNSVYAQKFKKEYKYLSLGFNLNAMNYVGELDPDPGFFSPGMKFTRENIGLSLSKRMAPRISIRGNISHGVIQGDDYKNASWNSRDIYRKIRNLSFKSSIWEIKSDVVIDLIENRGKPVKRVDYTPYISFGLAYFHHNPKAKSPVSMGGNWVALQPLELEGKHYSLNQVAIPVGLGFRYKLGKRCDLAFEMSWRFTFTDYLDDVSGTYKGREFFGDNQLAIAMNDRSMEGLGSSPQLEKQASEKLGYNTSNGYVTLKGFGRSGDQRGDSKRKDWYTVTGFHLNYIIYSKNVKCPPKFRGDIF